MVDAAYVVGVRQQINIPNWLTVSRIVLTAPVIIFGALGWHWTAVVLVAIAGITDGLDGYLARKWGQATPLGRVGDPLADKLFVDFVLLAVGVTLGNWIVLTLWVVTLFYDFDNTWQRRHEIGRALLNYQDDRADLPASWISKCKTALLFFVVGCGYVPEDLTSLRVLEYAALVAVGAVAYSWFNNRKDWLRQKLFGY